MLDNEPGCTASNEAKQNDQPVFLERAKAGDIEAFELLIAACQKKVYNIALRMTGHPEDASELAQEVFLKAFRSIRSFKGESSFSTWIYRITTNVCLDHLRKQKDKKVVSLSQKINGSDNDYERQIEDMAPTPDVIAENNELKEAVKEAIECLAEEQRTVIVLRDVNGLSYDEMASILGCPQGTIKSRINRARKALKDILLRKKEQILKEYVKYNERRDEA